VKHTPYDFWLTAIALVGGGFLWTQSPDSHSFVSPLVMTFVGSWVRSQLPGNGNGNGNGNTGG
jgi:hypothetical protein